MDPKHSINKELRCIFSIFFVLFFKTNYQIPESLKCFLCIVLIIQTFINCHHQYHEQKTHFKCRLIILIRLQYHLSLNVVSYIFVKIYFFRMVWRTSYYMFSSLNQQFFCVLCLISVIFLSDYKSFQYFMVPVLLLSSKFILFLQC